MTGRLTRLAVLAGLAAGAFALPGQAAEPKPKISPTIIPNFNMPDLSAKNNAYKLSPEELAYDCKKLTGHMRLRIRQLRVTLTEKQTSQVSRTMQHAVTPFVAGTMRGINPDGDNARDRSMLVAYNGQLAAKSCATYDLDRLLAPGNTEEPRPTPKAGKKPSSPFALKAPKAPAATAAPVPAVGKP